MIPKNVNYYDSTAYEASAVVKATPGTVFSITGYNSHSAAIFVQLHDAASLPADTAVPKIILQVPATSNLYYDLSEFGRFCEKGIVVCNSSTAETKTLGNEDIWFNIQYT